MIVVLSNIAEVESRCVQRKEPRRRVSQSPNIQYHLQSRMKEQRNNTLPQLVPGIGSREEECQV